MTKGIYAILSMVLLLCMVGCHQLQAQQVGVWFDSELQVNDKGKCSNVNLLYLSGDYAVGPHFSLSAATLSIVKTRSESLIDDLQGFSNIEADNVTLALALACIGWTPNERHSLSVGIRNVNEDYFKSPVTSLFFNSSCGIFPTLSLNMDIANYPLASMGLHYRYSAPSYSLQASVYNGQGYDRWAGHDNIWRVAPRADGLFMIAQGDWQMGTGHYYAGAALHTGTSGNDAGRSALWAYTEQSLTERLSLIADYSHAFGHSSQCTDFVGFGGQYTWHQSTLGFFTNYARFRHDSEWATELTYKYDLTSFLFLQASCQLIHHGSWQPVGLLRMSIRI